MCQSDESSSSSLARSVRFSPYARMRRLPPDDETQVHDLWYTEDDYRQFQQEVRASATSRIETDDWTSHGLDHWLPQRRKRQQIQRASVLREWKKARYAAAAEPTATSTASNPVRVTG